MTDEKVDIDMEKITKAWFKWVKREWFTVVAIIIILLVTAWHQTTISDTVKENLDRCNAYYIGLIEKECPLLLISLPPVSQQYLPNEDEHTNQQVSKNSNP